MADDQAQSEFRHVLAEIKSRSILHRLVTGLTLFSASVVFLAAVSFCAYELVQFLKAQKANEYTVTSVGAFTPAIGCRPCQTSSEVMLMIGPPSEDYQVRTLTRLWVEKHSQLSQRYQRERIGEIIGVVIRHPANIAEFRKQVQEIADDCKRIRSLGIVSHGNVGYLQIGSDGIIAHNIDKAFGHGFNCVMSQNATVEFSGCNVGRGCKGADFMLQTAIRLLPQGGKVVAPEYYVFGNAFLRVAPQSIFGNRELQVGDSASHPRWTKGTDPGLECMVKSSTPSGAHQDWTLHLNIH